MKITRQILPCPVALFALLLPFCSAAVPAGFEQFPTGYYKLHPEKLSWGDAWHTCRTEGAHLVIVNSDAEANVLMGMFAHVPGEQYFHVGIHDKYKEGEWVTIWGTPLSKTGYARWNAGEPNNLGNNENCGVMEKGGLLNDGTCAPQSFICEI